MSSHATHVCWEWQRDDGGFCPYLPEVSSGVESAYMASQKQFTVYPYSVDFPTMTQRGTHGGKWTLGIFMAAS